MRAVLAMLLLTAACGTRAVPYRFAGPLVGSVSVDEPFARTAKAEAEPEARSDEVTAATELGGAYAQTGARSETTGTVVTELPAPHLEPKPKSGMPVTGIDEVTRPEDLRALTGRRDGRDGVAFVIDAAGELGAPAMDATDGPSLVALADERGALHDASATIEPGDILVFDRALDDAPATLVAIAIARDERGVIEMIYLAKGVVRRGFLDPARPHTKRDADGRIVNTFLRHGTDYPPKGTKYLAAELLAHVIRAREL